MENTLFLTVSVLLSAYSFPRERVYRAVAQKLQLYIRESGSHCIATAVLSLSVSRSLPSNGVRHTIDHIRKCVLVCSSCHATRTVPVFLVVLFKVSDDIEVV
jgi:hypothetical protein